MIISLRTRMPPDDWERACAIASMLEAREALRLARRRAMDHAWRNRPRPPALPQQRLDWTR